jgi:hypothetical protein
MKTKLPVIAYAENKWLIMFLGPSEGEGPQQSHTLYPLEAFHASHRE